MPVQSDCETVARWSLLRLGGGTLHRDAGGKRVDENLVPPLVVSLPYIVVSSTRRGAP